MALPAAAAVIFDVDGTIVDTNDTHVEAWHGAFLALGYDLPKSRIIPHIGEGGDHLVPAVLGPAAERAHGDRLRSAPGSQFLATAARQHFRVFPGSADLLEELRRRNVTTALATSRQREHLSATLRSAGFDASRLIDIVVTGSDANESKPAPDLIHAVLARFETEPARCVMVGDTPCDGQAASAADLPSVGLLCGGSPAEVLIRAGARAVREHPADLLRQLDDTLGTALPVH